MVANFPMVAFCSAVNNVYAQHFLGCCAACTSRMTVKVAFLIILSSSSSSHMSIPKLLTCLQKSAMKLTMKNKGQSPRAIPKSFTKPKLNLKNSILYLPAIYQYHLPRSDGKQYGMRQGLQNSIA